MIARSGFPGFCLTLLLVTLPGGAYGGIVLDSPMDSDPPLDVPVPVRVLSPAVKALWYEALAGPESELKLRAAEAIAKARLHDLDPMRDAAPHLRRVLSEPDLSLPVQLATARALIVIGTHAAADDLLREARRGEVSLCQVIEPALAEWDHQPARAMWLKRINDPDTHPVLRSLAVRCLGTVAEPAASQALQSIVSSPTEPAHLRLEAARSVGSIEDSGLEEFASSLATDQSPKAILDRLAAASVLRRHRSDQTTSLLQTLAVDPEPTIAATALQWLLDTDPKLVLPVIDQVIASPDANVRHQGARALVALPSTSSVESLAPLLDDRHPAIRAYVRDSLFEFASHDDLNQPVRAAGIDALDSESWRALEQACLLLGALDHEPAADRLIALLDHPRAEVMISAAWALRKLAVPETLQPMLDQARQRTEELKDSPTRVELNDQVAQLFQAFGQTKYESADELMRVYVPKSGTFRDNSRMAAIWALGHLHAGQPDEALVNELQARIRDIFADPPESEPVRRMSAITLGRMKAAAALDTLREFDAPGGAADLTSGACNWAVTQITGEPYPRANSPRITKSGWFLEPLNLDKP